MNRVAAKLAQQTGVTGTATINAKLAKTQKGAPKLTLSSELQEPSRAKRPGLQTPNKTGGLRLPKKEGESMLSP